MAALGSETHEHAFDTKEGPQITRIICSNCGKGLGSMVSTPSSLPQIMPFMVSDADYNGDDLTYMTLYHVSTETYSKHPTLCPECWEKSKTTKAAE